MAEYDAWAEYYDLIHGGLPGEAEFYVGQAVRIGGETLELGCGTGRLAIPMAMAGVDVVGLDNSAAMLRVCLAKKRAVGATPGALRLIQADMRGFALRRQFSFIAMAYRTFMHLLTPEDQRRCLRAVRDHLKEDGIFILNVWAPRSPGSAAHAEPGRARLKPVERRVFPALDGILVDDCSTRVDKARRLFVEDHVVREIDREGVAVAEARLSMVRAWTRPERMRELGRLSGFALEAVFGDFDCSPFGPESTEMIWILRAKAGGGQNRFPSATSESLLTPNCHLPIQARIRKSS